MAQPNPVLELISRLAEQSVQSARSVAAAETASAAEGKKLTQQAIDLTGKIGANEAITDQARRAGELQQQELISTAVTGARATDVLADTLAQMTAVQNSLSNNLNAIRALQEENTGFNPIKLISTAIQSIPYRRGVAVDSEQLQALSAGANQIASTITSVGAAAQAEAKKLSLAGQQAATDNIALTAQRQQALLALEGLRFNTQGVRAAAEADDKTLQVATQLGTFQRMEEQFQLALEQEARQREMFNWQKEKETAIRNERLDEKAFEDRTIQYINLGEAARGLPASSPQEIRDMIRLNKGLSTEYAELYQNGRIAATTGQAVISTSPAKVASILAGSPELVASLDEQQKKVASLLLEATKVLGDKAVRQKEGLDDDKGGVKAQRIVGAQIQELVRRQLSFVGNNPDNPFYVGDLTSYIGSAASPGVAVFQKYPLVEKVLNPAIAANSPRADSSAVFKMALGSVQRGEITSVQAAADLTNIYRRASAIHRQGSDFRKFAISLPPDGGQYKVKIEGEIVDLTDFNQVARLMAKSLQTAEINKKLNERQIPAGFLGRLPR